MAIFNVSFRIRQVGDHAARYQSVVEKIRDEAGNSETWEETTSFFIIESPKTATNLCDSIYFNSDFVEDWDKLLVVNLSAKEHAKRGKFDYPSTLESLLLRR